MAKHPHVVVVVYILCVLGLFFTGAMWEIQNIKRSAGIQTARTYADSIILTHDFYSEQIVPRITALAGRFDREYEVSEDTFPFPGRFVMDVGNAVASQNEGMQLALYSHFPFKWRRTRTLDTFQVDAISTLTKKPSNAFFKFSTIDGVEVVRYALPSVMRSSCINCHNSPEMQAIGPKIIWKIGDVRGVQEVTVPLEQYSDQITKVILVTASFALLASILGGVLIWPTVTQLQIAVDSANVSNTAKSSFLSSMSHELRTPLNAILGFAQLLDMDDKPSLNTKQKKYLSEVMKGGHLLLELVNQVLDLSKIESSNLNLKIQATDPSQVVQQCISMLATHSAKKNITISHHVPVDEVPSIEVDAMRFQQVILNILTNAIKYNRQDGSIDITYESITDQRLRLVIEDTGIGIADEECPSVFEAFKRAGLEDGNIEGAGIGLTISKQLVELMSGKINLTSKLDKGTRVWVEFPVS